MAHHVNLPKSSLQIIIVEIFTVSGVPNLFLFFDITFKNLEKVSMRYLSSVGECTKYIHANFQDTTIYNQKVTKDEVELFINSRS